MCVYTVRICVYSDDRKRSFDFLISYVANRLFELLSVTDELLQENNRTSF